MPSLPTAGTARVSTSGSVAAEVGATVGANDEPNAAAAAAVTSAVLAVSTASRNSASSGHGRRDLAADGRNIRGLGEKLLEICGISAAAYLEHEG